MFKNIFGIILAALTASRLKPLTTSQQIDCNQINPFPNGNFAISAEQTARRESVKPTGSIFPPKPETNTGKQNVRSINL